MFSRTALCFEKQTLLRAVDGYHGFWEVRADDVVDVKPLKSEMRRGSVTKLCGMLMKTLSSLEKDEIKVDVARTKVRAEIKELEKTLTTFKEVGETFDYSDGLPAALVTKTQEVLEMSRNITWE